VAGGTAHTSYICPAPITPVNGFWLYQFIKLISSEACVRGQDLSVLLDHGQRSSVRFGASRPPTAPDTTLRPPADFDALVEAFRTTGFGPGNAWYLNDTANTA